MSWGSVFTVYGFGFRVSCFGLGFPATGVRFRVAASTARLACTADRAAEICFLSPAISARSAGVAAASTCEQGAICQEMFQV